ncbi:MAG: VCBS repeat-containing protein [Verrucomicrobia bacterium]|nr:VCBS repeat-containing protein [Verrucomicrobiota bacterium]
MKTTYQGWCAVLLLGWNLAVPLCATTFTEITTGSIVTDTSISIGVAWADYDKDGNLDLFVANSSNANNFLYHNNGDGTFTKIMTGSIVTDGGNSTGCAWGDYDNDGFPDLFVTNDGPGNFLYHNNGDGTFTKITTGAIVTDVGHSYGCAWGDYDNDGYLDLYVANLLGPNFLYHNNGDGTFTRVNAGAPATDSADSVSCAWGDYDHDGWLDLFVANANNQNNALYNNNGDGTFTKITTGAIVTDGGDSISCAWADYDGDGFLDMYVGNRNQPNFLYHNNGDGTFTKITAGSIVTDVFDSWGSAWGDYNNDGYLDLFATDRNAQSNLLYQNNGDGTFTKITTGNLVTDGGDSLGCGWADFNGDGQLDLFVANWNNQHNFLYRNNGNARSWITIQCMGTVSNRDGVGVRVQVDATIGGNLRSQVRQISSGNGWDGSAASAHFGLGTATVSTLRIEWPSGVVQTLNNVAVNQILTVSEPPPNIPIITVQPQSQTVVFGANVSFSVQAVGVAPLNYQWRFNGTDIAGAVSTTLNVNGADDTKTGSYTALVSNANGSVTSHVATLTVLTTFTKITTGSVVTDVGNSQGIAWGDYDGDGNLDLFVSNALGLNNFLYHNNGDGTFTKVTSGSVVNDGGNSTGCAWGDYDNDGFPDLFVCNAYENNFLYHNNGDGTFTKVTTGNVVTDGGASYGCAWGDYDNDGYLDLYVANAPGPNFLYHNNGDGTFSRVLTGAIATDIQDSIGCAWGDYDDDGYLDLFVANGTNQNNALYHNNGDGTFTKITTGAIVGDAGYSVGCAWGDYDNDGLLDMYVANRLGNNFLYRNNGDGTFTKITTGSIVTDVGDSNGCSWGDYNNDGYLDLFVARWNGESDELFQNNGDGTFTKITTGSLVTDAGNGVGSGWGDYDGDGQLDLFVANWVGQSNFLYRNDGNNNKWITINCVGTASNHGGIGARVKVTATISGVVRTQVRQISSGNGWDGSAASAHFGLGDATTISTLRVEWPSGTLQTLNNVAVNQTLTLTEPTTPADVSVVMIASPNPVVQGSTFIYTIIAANNGPGTAFGVKVTDVIPAGLTFLSASSTAGTISGTSTVVCNLGTMTANSSAFITILASPTAGGSHPPTYLLANTVTITANSTDANSANNSDTATSTVRTDTDGDSIPDDWEIQYGLNPNDPADGSIDSDGDGYNNLQEFLLGTNPNQASVSFQITSVERAGIGNNILVTFQSTSGKNFRAEFSDTSPTGPSWTIFADNIPGTGSPVTVTHVGGALLRQRFYHVVLIP